MKSQKIIGLGTMVIGASLMMACADHKGFKSRITTPEDALKYRVANAAKEGRTLDLNKDGSRTLELPPRPEGAAPAQVNMNQNDNKTLGNFVTAVREAQNNQIAAQKATSTTGGVPADPQRPSMEAKNIQILKEIKDSLAKEAVEIIKGIDVRYNATSNKNAKEDETRFKVNVDMLLQVADREVLTFAEGEVSIQDQLSASKIVQLQMKVTDALTNELKLKGVEVYAACANEKCNEMQIMAMITRADGSKVSMVGVFGFDGEGKGTSLGNKLNSVQAAQQLSATARQDAETARVAQETAAKDSQTATVPASEAAQGGKVRVENKGEGKQGGNNTKVIKTDAKVPEKRYPDLNDVEARKAYENSAEGKRQAQLIEANKAMHSRNTPDLSKAAKTKAEAAVKSVQSGAAAKAIPPARGIYDGVFSTNSNRNAVAKDGRAAEATSPAAPGKANGSVKSANGVKQVPFVIPTPHPIPTYGD